MCPLFIERTIFFGSFEDTYHIYRVRLSETGLLLNHLRYLSPRHN